MLDQVHMLDLIQLHPVIFTIRAFMYGRTVAVLYHTAVATCALRINSPQYPQAMQGFFVGDLCRQTIRKSYAAKCTHFRAMLFSL